jgi:hypothetical protein
MYLFPEHIGPYICSAYCTYMYFRNVHRSVLRVLGSAPPDVGHKYIVHRQDAVQIQESCRETGEVKKPTGRQVIGRQTDKLAAQSAVETNQKALDREIDDTTD